MLLLAIVAVRLCGPHARKEIKQAKDPFVL